ncbi:MAG: PIG-L family deacetylase [Acidobacteria bacterium]|nr:PIG-L family deacetylase [Acidobacteriota bacterium]
MRILLVGAHPDDCELYAGGTIASWRAEGARVDLLVLTDGRLGSADPAAAPGEIARLRAGEAEAAARGLGAGIRFGGFPDGALADSRREATLLVARAIRELRPDVLASHDPWRTYELHPDHRACGSAVCDGMIAAREAHGLGPGSPPAHRPAELWLWGTDHPNHFVDVSAGLERKLDALASHASQFSDVAGWRERVAGWNARIGAERGMRAAEAFRRILA